MTASAIIKLCASGALVAALATPAGAAAYVPVNEHVKVVRVYDGDTIRVRRANGSYWTVRFLGIDTPETHRPGTPVQCFGPEASRFVKSVIPDGTDIRVKTDKAEPKYDRYGRLLACVYKGSTFVSDTLVRKGYAHFYPYNSIKAYYFPLFAQAEGIAKKYHRGFWSPSTCNGDTKQPEPPGGFPAFP